MAIYDKSRIIRFPDNSEFLEDSASRKLVTYYKEHIIKETETLFSISRFYFENTSSWHNIAEANDLLDPIVLVPGETLIIPTYAPTS